MAQPTADLSSSLQLTNESEPPVVAINLFKTVQQQLAVQHFVDSINSLTTLFQSLPVKTEYDEVTDTYTRGAIRSWHMINIGLLNSNDQHYRQQMTTLAHQADYLRSSIQRHFGAPVQLHWTSYTTDPPNQLSSTLQHISAFYRQIPKSPPRQNKHTSSHTLQSANSVLLMAVISAIASTLMPIDYYLADFFKEISNINRHINIIYKLTEPASIVPTTFFRNEQGSTSWPPIGTD